MHELVSFDGPDGEAVALFARYVAERLMGDAAVAIATRLATLSLPLPLPSTDVDALAPVVHAHLPRHLDALAAGNWRSLAGSELACWQARGIEPDAVWQWSSALAMLVVGVRQALGDLVERFPAEPALRLAVLRQLDDDTAHLQIEVLQRGASDGRALAHHLASESHSVSRELDRQRQVMETLIQHAPVSLAYVDRDLVFRWNNQTHCRTLGRAREEIIGRSAFVACPGIVSRTEMMVRRALDHGELGVLKDLPILHQTEQRQSYWDLTYVPVPGWDGRPEGVLIIGDEVTDRVEATCWQAQQIDRLRELDQLKNQFLGIISHELRTPINAITGFGSILAEGIAGPVSDTQQRYLEKMLDGTEALMRLIDDLLDMSRLQAGKFSIRTRAMALHEVVAGAAEVLRLAPHMRGHELACSVSTALPLVHADPQRVMQVLANLVSNAAKFSPEGGTIRVLAIAREAEVRVEVRDDGPGIQAADLERIFEPFEQADGSATRARGGTGLGLSICKGLVELHGGRIGVESTPGAGSTFWFTLPVTTALHQA